MFTEDGAETDLDLEPFTSVFISTKNGQGAINFTSGSCLYQTCLKKETAVVNTLVDVQVQFLNYLMKSNGRIFSVMKAET